MAMGEGGNASGTSRNVTFMLRAETAQDAREVLRSFGEELLEVQRRIDQVHASSQMLRGAPIRPGAPAGTTATLESDQWAPENRGVGNPAAPHYPTPVPVQNTSVTPGVGAPGFSGSSGGVPVPVVDAAVLAAINELRRDLASYRSQAMAPAGTPTMAPPTPSITPGLPAMVESPVQNSSSQLKVGSDEYKERLSRGIKWPAGFNPDWSPPDGIPIGGVAGPKDPADAASSPASTGKPSGLGPRSGPSENEMAKIEAYERRHLQMSLSVQHANRLIASSYLNIGQAVMQSTAGIMQMGLSGSETAEKLLRGFAAVQGVMNTVTGVIDASRSFSMPGYYSKRRESEQGILEYLEGRISKLKGGLPIDHARGLASGVGHRAGGTSAGSAGAAGDLWTGEIEVVPETAAKGAAAAKGGGMGAGLLGTAGVSAGGLLGASAAAGAGTLAAIVSAFQTIGDIRQFGFMGGTVRGSWREKVGEGTSSFLTGMAELFDRYLGVSAPLLSTFGRLAASNLATGRRVEELQLYRAGENIQSRRVADYVDTRFQQQQVIRGMSRELHGAAMERAWGPEPFDLERQHERGTEFEIAQSKWKQDFSGLSPEMRAIQQARIESQESTLGHQVKLREIREGRTSGGAGTRLPMLLAEQERAKKDVERLQGQSAESRMSLSFEASQKLDVLENQLRLSEAGRSEFRKKQHERTVAWQDVTAAESRGAVGQAARALPGMSTWYAWGDAKAAVSRSKLEKEIAPPKSKEEVEREERRYDAEQEKLRRDIEETKSRSQPRDDELRRAQEYEKQITHERLAEEERIRELKLRGGEESLKYVTAELDKLREIQQHRQAELEGTKEKFGRQDAMGRGMMAGAIRTLESGMATYGGEDYTRMKSLEKKKERYDYLMKKKERGELSSEEKFELSEKGKDFSEVDRRELADVTKRATKKSLKGMTPYMRENRMRGMGLDSILDEVAREEADESPEMSYLTQLKKNMMPNVDTRVETLESEKKRLQGEQVQNQGAEAGARTEATQSMFDAIKKGADYWLERMEGKAKSTTAIEHSVNVSAQLNEGDLRRGLDMKLQPAMQQLMARMDRIAQDAVTKALDRARQEGEARETGVASRAGAAG